MIAPTPRAIAFLSANIFPLALSAAPLDPYAFASSGSIVLPPNPGAYTLNSDTLQLVGPGVAVTGTFYGGSIAVFAFDSFTLQDGGTIQVSGKRPVALLARTDLVIAGTIKLDGASFNDPDNTWFGGAGVGGGGDGGRGGPPPFAGIAKGGTGYGNGGGSGGEMGPNATRGGGGGGGFGTSGAAGRIANVATFHGGPAYGDLLRHLQGGSGGGGASDRNGAGAGGGAIELGAGGTIMITGRLSAHGGNGGTGGGAYAGGGGGSGGGVLIHAKTVALGTIDVAGGQGGPGQATLGDPEGVTAAGGAGGLGRVVIQATNSPTLTGVSGVVQSVTAALLVQGLDFGRVSVGETKTLILVVQNSGDAGTTISGRFPPAQGSPFARSGIDRFSSVPAGGASVCAYTFSPSQTGTFTQSLLISSDAGDLAVSLTGIGVVAAASSCTADLGIQGGGSGHDGVLDNNDFIAFIDAFFSHTGCP